MACRAVARARLCVAEVILDLIIILLEGRLIGPVGGMRLAVTAEIVAPGRRETWLEELVGRISLEPSVSRAGWTEKRGEGG